jgi:hypothetical protein
VCVGGLACKSFVVYVLSHFANRVVFAILILCNVLSILYIYVASSCFVYQCRFCIDLFARAWHAYFDIILILLMGPFLSLEFHQ